jgi:hypothetical protein
MDVNKFVLTSISVYNYRANNENVEGTCEFKHDGTGTKMSFKLEAADIAKIFEVIAGSAARTMSVAANSMLQDMAPTPAITSDTKKYEKEEILDDPRSGRTFMNKDDIDIDDISF